MTATPLVYGFRSTENNTTPDEVITQLTEKSYRAKVKVIVLNEPGS